MTRATRDWKQIECSYRGELDYLDSTSEAALHFSEDYGYGDAAHCRTAFHRPVVSPAKEAAENTERASQIGRTDNIAGTSGEAPLVKEAAENALEAFRIVGTAKEAETLGAATEMHSENSRDSRSISSNEQLT